MGKVVSERSKPSGGLSPLPRLHLSARFGRRYFFSFFPQWGALSHAISVILTNFPFDDMYQIDTGDTQNLKGYKNIVVPLLTKLITPLLPREGSSGHILKTAVTIFHSFAYQNTYSTPVTDSLRAKKKKKRDLCFRASKGT